jgi:hypothetical protein
MWYGDCMQAMLFVMTFIGLWRFAPVGRSAKSFADCWTTTANGWKRNGIDLRASYSSNRGVAHISSSKKMRSLFAVLLSLLMLSATTTVAAELRGEIVSCSG